MHGIRRLRLRVMESDYIVRWLSAQSKRKVDSINKYAVCIVWIAYWFTVAESHTSNILAALPINFPLVPVSYCFRSTKTTNVSILLDAHFVFRRLNRFGFIFLLFSMNYTFALHTPFPPSWKKEIKTKRKTYGNRKPTICFKYTNNKCKFSSR